MGLNMGLTMGLSMGLTLGLDDSSEGVADISGLRWTR